MPFRRWSLSRELDRREQQAKVAACELIARVSACSVSDPDVYDVKAAVLTRARQTTCCWSGSPGTTRI